MTFKEAAELASIATATIALIAAAKRPSVTQGGHRIVSFRGPLAG
jgi:hypothetical protein